MWRLIRRRLAQGQLLPWRWTHLGGLLNTLLLVHLRRPWLRWQAGRSPADADITVVLGHRNRPDFRLVNALRSITTQAYGAGRIHVLVVDYGSDPGSLARLRQVTAAAGAECVAVGGVGTWNRSHCLNVGIRRVRTRYLMVSDVDILLSPAYLAEAVSRLEQDPLAMVLSPCLHLPESLAPLLEAAAAGGEPVDTGTLRPHGVVKTADGYSTGIVVARTEHFRRVRGFDEWYREYGSEDEDLVRRFTWLGLRPVVLTGPACYLHQWHPRHEGVRSPGLRARIAANARYLEQARGIRRNPGGWGEVPAAGETAVG